MTLHSQESTDKPSVSCKKLLKPFCYVARSSLHGCGNKRLNSPGQDGIWELLHRKNNFSNVHEMVPDMIGDMTVINALTEHDKHIKDNETMKGYSSKAFTPAANRQTRRMVNNLTRATNDRNRMIYRKEQALITSHRIVTAPASDCYSYTSINTQTLPHTHKCK